MSEEKYQAVVIGGGPAGLAAAMTMVAGGLDDIVVLERGAASGSKNVFGGILYTPSLERLVPEIWLTDAPLERPVTRRTFSILSDDSAADFSFRCGSFAEPPYNHSYTVLRGRFDRWLAGRAEEAGVMIINGILVDGLLKDEKGKYIGIKTKMEEGTDVEEGTLLADVIVLAEGANSLIAEREGLRPKILPQDMAMAVKEVISLPETVIRDRFNLGDDDGEGREYYGEAVRGLFGSGFVYTNRDSISVGIAVSIRDLAESGLTPNDLLEHFKEHPCVAPLLAEGRTLEYSAHMIPEGGYHRIGRLFADGLMVVGDAAGLLNVSPYHEGVNLAVASGIAAGETAVEAAARNDFSIETLSAYEKKIEESFVLKDMKKFAGMPGFVRENPHVFSRWPTTLIKMIEDLFTISEESKQALEDRALERFQNEVGLLPFLMALFGWRGATQSLYHEATEKMIEQLGQAGIGLFSYGMEQWMKNRKS